MAPITSLNVPIIWILGGPGSGKGTQCDKIVEKYGFTHISSGDLLRAEVQSGSKKGNELSAIMERGELVPVEIVLDLIKAAILKALPTSKGFLIDGYPREKEQDETLTSRLLDRAKTSGRVDDNIETIKKRLQTFNTFTNAILEHYSNKLIKISAEKSTDEIFEDVTKHFDLLVA